MGAEVFIFLAAKEFRFKETGEKKEGEINWDTREN